MEFSRVSVIFKNLSVCVYLSIFLPFSCLMSILVWLFVFIYDFDVFLLSVCGFFIEHQILKGKKFKQNYFYRQIYCPEILNCGYFSNDIKMTVHKTKLQTSLLDTFKVTLNQSSICHLHLHFGCRNEVNNRQKISTFLSVQINNRTSRNPFHSMVNT